MANVRPRCPENQLFERGTIHLETNVLHTVHALSVDLPVNRLTAVTGVSGSGKTTLVLEELIPALNSANADETLPASVRGIDPAASSARSLSTQRPSARTCARPSPPIVECSTTCAARSLVPMRQKPRA